MTEKHATLLTCKAALTQHQLSKVKPPFPNLSIFNVTALVLSLFGFEDEVKDLLWALSPKTRMYFVGHREILSSFLAVAVITN